LVRIIALDEQRSTQRKRDGFAIFTQSQQIIAWFRHNFLRHA
jgi:hypothetical protein